MSLTELAIRKNRITGVLLTVLILSGVSAYGTMPQQMDPGFVIRAAQIVTRFPGASPDRVEKLVTDRIEQAVQSLPELDFVGSTSRTGVSVVSVNVREEFKNVRPIWDSLRRKIDAVRSDLPDGIVGPDVNDELGDIYPIMFSMITDGVSDREMIDTAKAIRDQLLRIEGVGKVEIIGLQDERIFVEYSNALLAKHGLSPQYLEQTLRARNIIMPGGEIDIGPDSLALEPSGNFLSVEDLEKTLVPLGGGGFAALADITSIERGRVEPARSIVTVNGFPAVTFAVSMSDGHNLVELGASVEAFFAGLPEHYPHGIDFERTYFQPKDVRDKVDEFVNNVLQAIGIVLVVMLITLGLRTGLIVSTLIPATMIIAIWVMSLVGQTINQMSLASLIIALGLLVDNAIVVSESILVRMNKGEAALSAAVESCRELRGPLLISSLTTCAAFLPIYLAESAVGEYTGALFIVVSITLLVSWVLALTMTPLLCTLFLRGKSQKAQSFDGRLYRAYRSLLRGVLRRRVLSLVVVVGVFFGSLPLWGLVPQIFFPAQDSPFFMAELLLPDGTNIETTRRMSAAVDELIAEELAANTERPDGITSWTTFIGATPPPFTLGYTPSPSLGGYCEIMVHATSVPEVRRIMDRLNRFALDRFPDVRPNIRMLASGPPVDKPVQIRISGPQTDRLFALVDKVRAQLVSIPGTRNVGDDWGAQVKKLAVSVNENRARRAGVTNQDVAVAMQAFLSGMETTRYREDDESIPVVLRSVAADRRDLNRVRNLAVFSPSSNQSVPLSEVASVSLTWEPGAILRRDRYRTVTVEAGINDDVTAAEVFAAIAPWLEREAAGWELGYRWEFGGEQESSVKANAAIGAKLPIAALVIVLLLVSQFNSLRKPAIVLSTIVLALVGVVIGLLVMGSSFGFMTLLGVISLAGIVINNAIVLIDRIDIEIGQGGRAPVDAVIAAAQQRARPILLTTATTVASLIPLYVAGGDMWQPMAVAIMYGLVFSTLLTLLVVPLLYTLFYRVAPPAVVTPAPSPEHEIEAGDVRPDHDITEPPQ